MRIFLLLILFCAGIVAAVVLGGGGATFKRYAETSPPEIKITQMPRGVGINPTSMKFDLFDNDSGLDEVVVRTRQKGNVREIFRQSLGGEKKASVAIDFPGEKSGLEEGTAYIEIKAFDRSFWNNYSSENFAINVDYRKPRLEALSLMHNARRGGSQLVFYRTSDDNLAVSGVKAGNHMFFGYPAKGLDSEIEDPDVYAVIYGLDLMDQVGEKDIRLFAEDRAGNETQVAFYNRVFQRSPRNMNVKLTDGFMSQTIDGLAERYFQVLAQRTKDQGYELRYESAPGSNEYLIEEFQLVNTMLRDYSEEVLTGLFKGLRFESYWTRPFSMPQGSINALFGDRQKYSYQNRDIGENVLSGYEIVPSNEGREVTAASSGVVLFAEDIGVYGTTVAIDHGMGVVSLYGHLSAVNVKKGATVGQDQVIGIAGNTGFSRHVNSYFGIRIQGVPVDPVEWTDEGWFKGHIKQKINDLKKILGIAVYKPRGETEEELPQELPQ